MDNVFYGGAFDPLTLAHERIISELYGEYGDRLVVGVTDHDYKQSWKPVGWRRNAVWSYCQRLCPDANVVVQDCRTFDFLSRNPDLHIGTVVVGTDEMKDLVDGKWRHSDELLKSCRFLVIPRSDGISSTKVRNLVGDGASDGELLEYVSMDILGRIREC